MFCTLSIKDAIGSYSNSGHRHCCNNDRALHGIVIFTAPANVWLSLDSGKQFHLEQYPCFIPLLVVTPPPASRARERNPLGKLRSRIVRLQMRSFILLITHITFIYHIRLVPIKLFVCIIGVLASTRFEINLPKWYLVQKPAVVSNPTLAWWMALVWDW